MLALSWLTLTRCDSSCAVACAGASVSRHSSSAFTRRMRWRNWRSWNSMLTEMPCSSRCEYTLDAAARQASSCSRSCTAAICAGALRRPSCSTARRSVSKTIGNSANGRAALASSDMRSRTSADWPAALIWLVA